MKGTAAYVVLAIALVAFGMLAVFSIGMPFLLTGLAMIVLFPWRYRRDVLWPTLAAIWGLVIGYLVVAPWGCTAEVGSGAAATTTCDGVFIDYSGGASYDAPLLPALVVGLVVGALSAWALRALIRSRPNVHAR